MNHLKNLSVFLVTSLLSLSALADSPPVKLRVPAEGAVMTQITSFRSEETLAVMELLLRWEAEEKPEIWLKIDTNGGSIENGMYLIQMIESMNAKVVCVVDYRAYSFGMVLLQACPERVMTKRSVLMTHDAIATGIDYPVNADDLREMANNLEMASKAMMHGICERMNVTEAEYKDKTKGGRDWWLDYDEAVKYGAIDAYTESKYLPKLTFPKIMKLLKEH